MGVSYYNSSDTIELCNKNTPFINSMNINNVYYKNDSIPFQLSYHKDSCIIYNKIKFQKINIILNTKDYLSFNFGLGHKNDSIFTSYIFNDKPYVEDIQYFFSFKEKKYPKKLNFQRAFFPRVITIDSIYFDKGEQIFCLDSFYDILHEKTNKFEIHNIYISKKRGIFKVDIINNETKNIYTSR